MRNFFLLLSLFTLITGCHDRNFKADINPTDSTIAKNVISSSTSSIEIVSNEHTYSLGDSITVFLKKDNKTSKKLLFVVNIKNNKFEGVANLELIDDNGSNILPESTPRLDEKTNLEYYCDSTYSFQSYKISFVFAIENKTQKRLSFIVNNSLVSSINDEFYTLYKKKKLAYKSFVL